MDYYKLDSDKTFLISQKALVVEDNKLLILENASAEGSGRSIWDLPGGLLELDESLHAGLLREVREETGLLVTIGKIVAVWDYWLQGFKFRDGRVLDVKVVGVVFQCQKIGGAIQLSAEHHHFKWVTQDELTDVDFSPNSAFAVNMYLSDQSG